MPRQVKKRAIKSNMLKGLALGCIVALLGLILTLTPLGHWLEGELGLAWLFKLRGPQTPPTEVVVVSIDQASSKQLGLPNKPRLWPRSLHAEVIENLSRRGASAIFFDIIFEEQRNPEHNRQFATAMQQTNNVILFQYLKREILPLSDGRQLSSTEAHIEKLISPIPVLAESATGLAPFPLPVIPAKVDHYLLFKPELGDTPTMPVVMMQLYTLPIYNDLYQRLHNHIPRQITELPHSIEQIRSQRSIQLVAKKMRRLFLDNPQLAHALLAEVKADTTLTIQERDWLQAVITMYQLPDSVYLNFYGPPRTISTIPYYQLLHPHDRQSSLDLTNKAVFVGFSEEFQPEQKDGFYTVYTKQHSGLDISGVEIGATTFANLLQRNIIKATSPLIDIAILVFWSIATAILLRWIPGLLQIPVAIGLGVLYLFASYYPFQSSALWLPYIIPILWQLPLIVVGTLLWKYFDVQRERRNIRQAFGYHLPIEVVDKLADGIDHITATGQQVDGIVLATDAEQYTTLSEQLPPGELHSLLNAYYETLFIPIRQHGGVVSDVVGDAVLAFWATAHADEEQRQHACEAALQAKRAINEFNQQQSYALPTRMGLHCGQVMMGHVGAVDHYEYRAVGDIVNTASRIEGLNKQLGTRILASESVIKDLTHFSTRKLGAFLLAGKNQPLTLYELTGLEQNQPINYAPFDSALDAFMAQHWDEAMSAFQQFINTNGEDGPSRFYLTQCQKNSAHPPEEWDGVIKLITK